MELPHDLMRLVIGMALLVPLSYPMKWMPPFFRNWYSLLLGFVLQGYVFRDYLYPILIQHIIVFALIKICGPRCGKIVTIESLVALSAYHFYQIFTNYGGWSMKAEALLMILTCKYSLLAYNIEDGSLPTEKCSKQQIKNRITEEVSFIDFLGYCNFLPSCLVGPPLEYRDYKQFIQGQTVYGNIPINPLHKRLLITFGETLLFGGLYVFSEMYFPLSGMREESFYDNSIGWVLIYVFLSVSLARTKYYFGWKLSMCAVHSSGASWNGSNFERINTVNPLVVETTIHVRQKINYWNISVQEWLRKSIYQRTNFKSKTSNQMFVFMISAFWHGFYGAYYISFVLWFAQLHLQGLIFKYCSNGRSILVKIYKKMGKLGTVLLSFLVQFLFSHCAASFLILRGYYCIKLLLKIYFMPAVVLFLMITIFSVIKPPRVPKGDTEEKKGLAGEEKKGLGVEEKKGLGVEGEKKKQ